MLWRQPPRSDPSRFALGVTLPSEAAAWNNDRSVGHPRDLARQLTETERCEHANTLARVLDLARRAGVRIVEDLTAARLGTLFEQGDVVTLIAHAPAPGLVQLFDVAVDHDQVVRAVPPHFRGFVDLTSCQSEGLADRLRFERDLVVLGHARRVKLHYGLMIYLNTLADVIEARRSYEEALTSNLDRWMGDPTRWH